MLEAQSKSHRARVIAEHKTQFVLLDGEEEFSASMRGKFFFDGYEGAFPKVGDYVDYERSVGSPAVITAIKPRTSVITRKAPGGDTPQIIVVNVDILFIVMGLDHDYNLRRLERYVMLARQSGITPVIVLNKADIVSDVAPCIAEVSLVAPGIPVHAISARTKDNLEVLLTYFHADTTAVLLGSSGAGKSTITNWFLGKDKQAVKEVRTDDSRGRHTTSHRELFRLPKGGFLIDTPGMRELSLYGDEEPNFEAFKEFEDLMHECEYSNCDHEKSEGCAVIRALMDGRLDKAKYAQYLKLKKEAAELRAKIDTAAFLKKKSESKKRSIYIKSIKKRDSKDDLS